MNTKPNEPTIITKYFITVSWCGGPRGIFCQRQPHPKHHKALAFPKDAPHTQDEMRHILGPFALILDPQSRPYTQESILAFSHFVPLAEYTHHYGIAMRPEDFLAHIDAIANITQLPKGDIRT